MLWSKYLGRPAARNDGSMQVGGPNLAVLDGAASGIRFGPEGLTIALQSGKEKQAKSRLGSYYAKLPNGGRCLFPTKEKLKTDLSDLKVGNRPLADLTDCCFKPFLYPLRCIIVGT